MSNTASSFIRFSLVRFFNSEQCAPRVACVGTLARIPLERTAFTPSSGCASAPTRRVARATVLRMGTILLVVLVLLLLGVLPRWPHSRNWGYAPSGLIGVVLVVLLVLFLMGRI